VAFSFVGERGNANTKTAGTTLAMTVANSNIAAGALVIVRCVTDNGSTGAGASTDHSVSDSQSNTYTRLIEYCALVFRTDDRVDARLRHDHPDVTELAFPRPGR
jgi:hypothetical protein